ncbi:MAG TPA: CrcB family protein [Geodermatophilus sp.]|jgi:CrcB protein|nr:CrcB family protein [Geodermatophilus sp.]
MSTHPSTPVQVDPDVDLHVPQQRQQRAFDPVVLAVIAVGGVVGSEARYALHVWSPGGDGGWPWGTWWANVAGSLLLGALMVVLTELTSPHRLLRPFLGVGVLGGFTTFSTVMVEVPGLMAAGRPGMALGYLVGTAMAALVAAAVGVTAIRAAAAGWHRLRRRRSR